MWDVERFNQQSCPATGLTARQGGDWLTPKLGFHGKVWPWMGSTDQKTQQQPETNTQYLQLAWNWGPCLWFPQTWTATHHRRQWRRDRLEGEVGGRGGGGGGRGDSSRDHTRLSPQEGALGLDLPCACRGTRRGEAGLEAGLCPKV